MRWPGIVTAGTACDEFLTSLEIFPTLCAAAGCQLPNDIAYDGFDMAPVLAGKQKSQRKEMFWKRRGDKAARVGNWKWVDSAKGSGLFDLSRDIGEKTDLSKDKPDVLKVVQGRYAEWLQDMEKADPRGPFRDY